MKKAIKNLFHELNYNDNRITEDSLKINIVFSVYLLDENNNNVYTHEVLYGPEALYSELYYRNTAGNVYADYDTHKIGTSTILTNNTPQEWIENIDVLDELI